MHTYNVESRKNSSNNTQYDNLKSRIWLELTEDAITYTVYYEYLDKMTTV